MAERLNERMLAIWFMDDGHMRLRPPRRPSAEIATVGFDDQDLQVLLAGLTRLGIPAKASRGRLYFDVDATETLSEKIAPYVPPPMRYKLHPDVAALVPFDTDRLRAGHRHVLFDEVEVEDVTQQERADKTFFCIDVEETHNFVTAGGVVHNCRPPGNRDPLPLEIENCREYLYRQVELIQPRVICSLGNFSTKLLRDDPTGITRLHGKPQELTLGRRTVWLYPIFHPAAALYTPRMLETLREDFARLPELLAQPEPPQPIEGEAEALAHAAAAREQSEVGAVKSSDAASMDAKSPGKAPDGGSSAIGASTGGEESAGATDQLGLF
jgi:uracil-DNA glycosylase family 4